MTWGGVPGSVDAGGSVWEVWAGGHGRAMGWVVLGTEQQGARGCPEECTEDGPPSCGPVPRAPAGGPRGAWADSSSW